MILKFLARVRRKYFRIRYDRAIASESVEKRFSNIYKMNLWFSNKQSKSGSGSTLEATESLRNVLPEFLSSISAKNLVDVGCGDFFWMKNVELPCSYIGLDIVEPIIKENIQNYSGEMCNFFHHNAIDDPLPMETDVVLCREVLFHLSYEDGLKVIMNVLKSKARFFLVTTADKIEANKDIRTGSFRNINLRLPPYSFPAYMKSIDDNAISGDRKLGIWDLEEVRKKIKT